MQIHDKHGLAAIILAAAYLAFVYVMVRYPGGSVEHRACPVNEWQDFHPRTQ